VDIVKVESLEGSLKCLRVRMVFLVCTEGPNTVCRCNVERLADGRRKVTYCPVEVGIFTITIKWNGREIYGK